MELERKCMECWFCAEDTTPKTQHPLIGQKAYICLASPPTSSAVLMSAGVVLVASYPPINHESISCARHTPNPPATVRKIIRKGNNDG